MKAVLLTLLIWLAATWPALAAYELDVVGACETTTTTGTGTLSLGGAYTAGGVNYVTFASQVTSGDSVEYSIQEANGDWEHGRGVFTDDTTDTLTRDARWSSDGDGAEIDLGAGTHIVCQRWGPGALLDGVGILDLSSILADTIDIENADTTLARSAAGRASIEGSIINNFTASGSAPSSPQVGDVWLITTGDDAGTMVHWYDDGSSTQWVEFGPGGAAPSGLNALIYALIF